MQSGHDFHLAEEEAREKGNFLEALKLSDESTLLYQKEQDIIGLSEIQAARAEIFKNLFLQTDDRSFLILAKFAAKSGVKIAKLAECEEALAIPLFTLAKILTLLDNHEKAQEKYQIALKVLPKSPQNRPSVAADIKIHKAVCSYRMGNKDAIHEAVTALQELEDSGENRYEKDVWLSGGYMKIAETISKDDPDQARVHLEKAKGIVNANPELKLRKQQLEKLEEKLTI